VIVRLASFRSRLVWSVRFLLSMPCSSSWRRRRRACSAALRTVMATSAARLPAPRTAARARWRCGRVQWPCWSFPPASTLGAGEPRLVPGLILRAFYARFGRVSVQLHNDCEPCQVPTKKPRPEPGPRYQCGIAWLTVGGPTLRQQRRG
jgi:hypothetical protein